MNFDELKKELDSSVEHDTTQIKLDESLGLNNPVTRIRRMMKVDILIQLLGIIVFAAFPMIFEMHPLPQSLYYIFMFMVCLMTSAYVIKLILFIKRTGNFISSTQIVVRDFIYEAKLTLEVYKSFVIAGSLILPIPLFISLTGTIEKGNMTLFNKLIHLNLSPVEMILCLFSYLGLAIIIYLITVGYTNKTVPFKISLFKFYALEIN